MLKSFIKFSLLYRYWYLVAFAILVSQSLSGQKKDIIFTHFTVDNGLSQNTVDEILRDSRGFLWIATWNGLNKYDGYKIEQLFENSSVNHSLSNNFIHSLCEDKYGNIWIGTEKGLNVLIYNQNKIIQHFVTPEGLTSNRIFSLIIDSNGNLIVGTLDNGIDILKIDSLGKIENLHHFDITTEKSLPNNLVYGLDKDNLGNVFVCTANGFVLLDQFYNFSDSPLAQGLSKVILPDYRVFKVLMESPGKYWIATQIGVVFYDFETQKQTNYFEIPGNPRTILHNTVRDMARDIQGNIVFGTLGGLSILNRKTNTISNYSYNPGNQRSLNNNFINCVIADDDGNVWVGTDKGGVNKYNVYQNRFEYFTYEPGKKNGLNENIINSIYEDDKYLLIGTSGGGLNIYDKRNDNYRAFKNSSKPNSISGNFITSIHKDKQQRIWIGTWGQGLNYLTIDELNSGHFNRMSYSLSDTTTISSWFISSIASDSYGNIWIGSYDGLDKISSEGKLIRTNSEILTRIGCLLFDKNKNLWIGTEYGLYQLHAEKNKPIDARNCKITTYLPSNSGIPGRYIISLYQDHVGNIWVGTYDNGFSIVHLNKNGLASKFQNYNQKDGLTNNTVYGIIEDNKGNMWFSTDNGISCFDVESHKFRNFYITDGLLSNQFYWSAAYKNESGKIYFGGTSGLQAFHPDSINVRVEKPHIQLTKLKIYNQEVYAGEKSSPLTSNINDMSELKLHYNQNSFSLAFVSINYNTSELFEYSYLLEGVDKDWITPQNNYYEASYTKLQAGTYKFRVKVWERANPQNSDLKNLEIIIKPPFWKTWWFISLAILVVISLAVSFYYYRVNELRKNNILLEFKVKERTKELSERNKWIEDQNKAIKEQNEEINANNEQITSQKELLESQQTEMVAAYKELEKYRNQLEVLVDERTAELKKAKEKAEESDRLKSSFLANLSHEIRTPLNSIIGFSSILFDEDVSGEDRQTYRSIIESSGQTLLDLINDIIDISKIEAGHLDIYKTQVELKQVFDNLKEVYQLILNKDVNNINKNISLIIDATDELVSTVLFTDETRLKQIFTILINNAVKFTHKGSITVGGTLKQENNSVELFVKDTGIGIAKKSQLTIFDRFRKIEDNNTELYRGTGIGLSIAKSLVNLMNGDIRVESETGKGSTFFFTLPLNQEIGTSNNTKLNDVINTEIPDLKDKIILVAEDDLSNYKYLKFLLDKTKATILHATDGIQAVNLIETNPDIDMILLDIKMPKMDGYEVFNKIKSLKKVVPVIAQTAYALNNDVQRIKEAGFSEYISKPIKPKDFYRILEQYF